MSLLPKDDHVVDPGYEKFTLNGERDSAETLRCD